MATIGLTMLVKNCADTLEPLLENISPYFDQRIIVLGGKSKDKTAKIARKYATEVVPFDWQKDYAAGRNLGLDKVQTDFWFWVDGDDRVDGIEHIPRLLEHMEKNDLGRLDLVYHYSYDEYGHPTASHTRERILRTDLGWRWRDRIHEHAWTEAPHRAGFEKGVAICHQRKGTANLPERLELLLLMEANGEGTPSRRTMLLGDIYACMNDWEKALERFASYPAAQGSDVEHWHCCLMAADCNLQLGRAAEAHSWAMVAVDMAPQFRESWVRMAMSCWDGEQDADKTLEFCKLAEQAEPGPLVTFRSEEDYLNNLWDAQYRAFAQKGDWIEAAAVTRQAVERWPKHTAWREMANVCQEERRRAAVIDAIGGQVDYLLRRYDSERAMKVLGDGLPVPVLEDPRIKALRRRVEKRLSPLQSEGAYRDFYDDDLVRPYCPEWLEEPFARWAWVIDRLKDTGAKTICEVGCACGEFCVHAAKAGINVVGIDISRVNLAQSWDNAVKTGVEKSCAFVHRPLIDLPKTGWRFDAVTCMEVLEHLPAEELSHALDDLDSVADHVFITVPAEYISYGPGLEDKKYVGAHVREFSVDDLRRLVGSDRCIRNLYHVAQPNAFSTAYANIVMEYESKAIPARPKVALYLGPSPEYWEPGWEIDKGMGGSETATVAMARELDKRGYDVTVFAEANGVWDGVNYLPNDRVSADVHYDLFVSSRRPGLPIVPNANHVWLWEHDVAYPELTSELADQFEKILVLSEWHKGYAEKVSPFLNGKLARTSNGIMPELFSPNGHRQRHRFIYCSSPDRGLDILLGWWPKIREMWPDAELHTYYGWQYFPSDTQATQWKNAVTQLLNQPGVEWHGRTGQKELAKEFLRTQFWLYPSFHRTGADWDETFCITALEAQAAGCIPVTRPVAALPERLIYPECLVDSLDVEPFLERLRWWDELPAAEVKERRRKMRAYALKQTWGQVADQWIEMSTAGVREG
jgi:glycosyltransferase involved in cell wall biosynthesis